MKTEVLLNEQCNEALVESIKQSRFLQLSRETKPRVWQFMKARIYAGGSEGIRISEPVVTYGPPNVPSGKVSVSLRVSHKKLIFQSHYNSNILSYPDKIVQAQRRFFTREQPTKNVTVRFWKNEEQQICADLQNLSGSGMSVIAQADDYDGYYLCSVGLEPFPLKLEMIVRSVEPHGQQSIIGFQFLGVDREPEKYLNRIGKVLSEWKRRRENVAVPTPPVFTRKSQSFEASFPQTASKSLAAPHPARMH